LLRNDPYSPGAGLRPAALVGRDIELQDWSFVLQGLKNARCAKSVILHGLRGEGRSVLLGEFHRMVEERDWVTVIIEANTVCPLRDTLYPAVRELVRSSVGDKITKALVTFKAFGVEVDIACAWSFGLEVAAERGAAIPGSLRPT
jgi:hypothetical protein